jgi:hypothetical protein
MYAALRVSGTTTFAIMEIKHDPVGTNPNPTVSVELIRNMAAGEWVEAILLQKSGTSQNLTSSNAYTHFEAQYLGA